MLARSVSYSEGMTLERLGSRSARPALRAAHAVTKGGAAAFGLGAAGAPWRGLRPVYAADGSPCSRGARGAPARPAWASSMHPGADLGAAENTFGTALVVVVVMGLGGLHIFMGDQLGAHRLASRLSRRAECAQAVAASLLMSLLPSSDLAGVEWAELAPCRIFIEIGLVTAALVHAEAARRRRGSRRRAGVSSSQARSPSSHLVRPLLGGAWLGYSALYSGEHGSASPPSALGSMARLVRPLLGGAWLGSSALCSEEHGSASPPSARGSMARFVRPLLGGAWLG